MMDIFIEQFKKSSYNSAFFCLPSVGSISLNLAVVGAGTVNPLYSAIIHYRTISDTVYTIVFSRYSNKFTTGIHRSLLELVEDSIGNNLDKSMDELHAIMDFMLI